MALTFPRDLTGTCAWRRARLVPGHRQELSRTAAGETQGKDLGPMLWRADWASVPLPRAQADAAMAEFGSLRGAIHSFYLYPAWRPRPAAIPTGALSGVTVASIASDRSALSLAGLPAGAQMSAGDFLSIWTGAYTEFLRLVRPGTADGTGTTPEMETEPPVRSGVGTGFTVTLVEPLVEMKLVPDTLDDPQIDVLHRQIVFQAVQVIQA